jgi:DNA-directed RNA polymerase specialized sigma24 family protein
MQNSKIEKMERDILSIKKRIADIDSEKTKLKAELRYLSKDLTEELNKFDCKSDATIRANNELREENKALKELLVLAQKSNEMSYVKIAQFMGVTPGTIKQRFHYLQRKFGVYDWGK